MQPIYRAELENTFSLERVPDYRGFGLESFPCILWLLQIFNVTWTVPVTVPSLL